MKSLFAKSLILALFFLTNCAPYRVPTQCLMLDEKGLDHPLYSIVPRHRCQIRALDLGHWMTWTLLGNDDDGIFGEGLKASYYSNIPPCAFKALRWTARNPLHNFCYYVIGSAHRHNRKIALIDLRSKINESKFFIGFHGGKPFISFCFDYSSSRKGEFYIGWRERGNFGIKFLPFREKK